ncbi:hypothetical protein N7462_008956 [Penicillium macrosclerotiorum]|uniref:uncharacterized protein n=1 Tax=Penicillium macrosclerotiorum TaxID=303699 RepID=UPI0025479189|nr:uncharacterized protein N7462_008956 [Penicillium macrosclerotiorum]KAJ5676059.1 hypothetical protein N7462_008956 [Penicillium macrosclerotiorum]
MSSLATTFVNPLTTTFVPPAECTTDTYDISWSQSSGYTWWWASLGAEDWTTCFPSEYEPTSYFSPGICPEGYSAAGESQVTSSGEVETRATCCPSYYNAQTGTDWPWYTSNQCTSSNANASSVYSYTVTVSGTSTVTQTGTFGVNAKGVSIRWKSADFAPSTSSLSASSTTTTSASTPDTTSQAATATTIAASAAASDNSSQNSSSGLSTGAKAGMGVGIAAGAMIFITLAFWLYRRRRKTSFIQNGRIKSLSELGATPKPSELAARPNASELSALSPQNPQMKTGFYPYEIGSSEGSIRLREMSPVELDTPR